MGSGATGTPRGKAAESMAKTSCHKIVKYLCNFMNWTRTNCILHCIDATFASAAPTWPKIHFDLCHIYQRKIQIHRYIYITVFSALGANEAFHMNAIYKFDSHPKPRDAKCNLCTHKYICIYTCIY